MAGSLATKLARFDVWALAATALRLEVNLTPKPGLVDMANNGSHSDMDHALFLRSIDAITPWFRVFEKAGFEHALKPASEQLRLLRPAGMACEQAMFEATDGVNTHKGGIFSLGLICFAAGRLRGLNRLVCAQSVCQQVAEICKALVARELASRTHATTAGEKQYQQFGLTGARGEAELGFPTIRQHVLPYWYQEAGERRFHHALLRLMAINPDSNLVSRGGIDGLCYVQDYAQTLLKNGWNIARLQEMDKALISRNLSPGGSADLLAVSYVLATLG